MEKRNTEKEFIIAFWHLYDLHPIEKISIHALCQEAGYNRATFYNHFENIYDLLDKAVDNIFKPIKEDVLLKQDFRSILAGNMIENFLSTYFSQEHQYIEVLIKRHNTYLLNEKMKAELFTNIKRQLEYSNADFDIIEILLEYQISALLGVISKWFQQNKPFSEQELIKILYTISSKGVLHLMREEIIKK